MHSLMFKTTRTTKQYKSSRIQASIQEEKITKQTWIEKQRNHIIQISKVLTQPSHGITWDHVSTLKNIMNLATHIHQPATKTEIFNTERSKYEKKWRECCRGRSVTFLRAATEDDELNDEASTTTSEIPKKLRWDEKKFSKSRPNFRGFIIIIFDIIFINLWLHLQKFPLFFLTPTVKNEGIYIERKIWKIQVGKG